MIQPSSESESEEESCWLSAEFCAESTLVGSEAGGAGIFSLLSSRIVASSSEVSCWTAPASASSVCAGAGSDSVVTSSAFCSAGSWEISDAGNSFCSPAASLVGSSAWIPSLAGGAPFNPFWPGTFRSLQSPPFLSHSISYVKAIIWMSGLLRTARSPVLRAKSVTNLMLVGFGDLTVRKGFNVVSTRCLVAASLISDNIAGTVTRCSA